MQTTFNDFFANLPDGEYFIRDDNEFFPIEELYEGGVPWEELNQEITVSWPMPNMAVLISDRGRKTIVVHKSYVEKVLQAVS
jgi:hypothetical protein